MVWKYTLLASAYVAVETDFGTTVQSKTQPTRSGALLIEVNHSVLLRLIGERFSDNDLATLCYDLRIDPEEFEQKGKTNMIRQLIEHMHRRGRLRELIATVLQERPSVDWSPLFKD